MADPRALLQRRGLRLRRELGQNFLREDAVADRLAAAAGVSSGDRVLEIGTGLGVLTRALDRRGAEHILTIEIDSGIVAALREESLLPESAELIHADGLELDLRALIEGMGTGPVRLVANLPYSAATPLLRRLLDLRDLLADWSVMLQSEVAARCVATVGQRDYGSLAVLHHLTVDSRVQENLASRHFFPEPRVASSFLRVWPRRTPLLLAGELAKVERVVRAGFGQRRKTLANALAARDIPSGGDREALGVALGSAEIDPMARAESLAPEQWLALSRILADDG